ncbi:MAG: hypothetical protein GQ561_08165 [Calditrichae bacterium]|nr:hypothetical protein [Calditrichia bacterium]
MNNLVIYLIDDGYREEIVDLFEPPQYRIKMATDLKQVIITCQTDLVDLLLIWPATILAVADLQVELRKNGLEYLPHIAVVRKAQFFHELLNSRCLNVIQIPLPKKEFIFILDQSLQLIHTPAQGKPAELGDKEKENSNLINSLDRLCQNRESALISVTESGHGGRIYLSDGRIVRASFRALEGIDALKKMVGLIEADLTIHLTSVEEERELNENTALLLANLRNSFMEQQKSLEDLPPLKEKLKVQDAESIKIFKSGDIKRQIIELCQGGQTLYQLLTIMNQDNQEILKHTRELLQKKILISGNAVPEETDEQVKSNSFSERFKKLGNLFRISRKKSSRMESYVYENLDVKATEISANISEQVKIEVTDMDHSDLLKIKKFFWEA